MAKKKTIILCFDGTSNHPRDARQERKWFGRGEIRDNGITNVLKLHALFGGNLKNKPSNLPGMANQRSFYYSGVGTYGNRLQRMFNAGFAPSNMDVATIMFHAGEDLRQAYKKGDELIIVGFSRGAAIARKFASRLPRFLPAATKNCITLMAVFDTVASIGVPNLDDLEKPVSDVVFEDSVISPYIKEAVHLVSLDDSRIAFHPVLMAREPRVTEVWFAGAHSDVGGGFWRDGLSDIALSHMMTEISQRTDAVFTTPDKVDFDGLKHEDEYKIDFEDLDLKPNVHGQSHQQDRWGPIEEMTLETRSPRVVFPEAPQEGAETSVLLHQSVVDRIKKVVDYRPKALKGVRHRLVAEAGSVGKKEHLGLVGHIS
ncbi:DUF2235 domain-containing protein [Nisaea acidiphila]|uniref:DUF2235 domain-containing protein n=1 Tax=Nisaea acidiphila TaxID=1862145 RepID=A0A9J7AXD0_9PROT|nr:DUF2235 domain-containing protein [Nisaea acidiphila]UUX51936.1 DUF2235 domain-containing protein [Nisaea acidiphila]